MFGFWAMVLVLAMAALLGTQTATRYLDSRNFTEPMFVFAIMVVAGSRADPASGAHGVTPHRALHAAAGRRSACTSSRCRWCR